MLHLCFLRIGLCKTTRSQPALCGRPKPFRLSIAQVPFRNFAQKFTFHTHPETTESVNYVLQDLADFCQFFALAGPQVIE